MNWDLTKLYTGFDDQKLTDDLKAFETTADAIFEAIAVLDGTAALEAVIRRMQTTADLLTKIGNYTFLTLAVDVNNADANAFYGKYLDLQVTATRLQSALSRYLDGKNLDALIGESTLLKEHRFYLESLQKDAAHVIDPALEPIVLKMQATGSHAWEQLRDNLASNLIIPFEKDGRTEEMPLSAIRALAYDADPDIRKRAYEAELAAYPRMEDAMAACLNSIKGEALTLLPLQHHESLLDTALYASRMDRATLDALLDAMRESLPVFRRYLKLKAKMLGYEGGLKFYDLFAPVGTSARTYTLDEARALLVRVMGQFSEKMAKFIDHAFEDRWIDVYPRAGKQNGAFCSGVHPLKMSYVMTNFDGSFSSVSTFAHELGHAYHDHCMNDVSVLMSDYPMPLAETASIFNETLLAEKIMENADRDTIVTLLEQQLSDATQTVMDIYSRYLFETEMIRRRADHAVSAKEMCEIMLDAQKEAYGDGLDENCLHPYMWACKSHYYSVDLHFYNFPYAFGLLFGLGVFAQYREKGDAFLPEYDALLTRTGSADVRAVAASAGLNVADKAFWLGSIRTLEEKVNRLESLIG